MMFTVQSLLKRKEVRSTFIWIFFYALLHVYASYRLGDILDSATCDTIIQTTQVALWVSVLWLLVIFVDIISERKMAQAKQSLNQMFKMNILDYLSHISLDTFHQKETGNYVSWLTNDLTTIENKYFGSFFRLIGSGILSVLSFIALIYVHPVIALVSVISLLMMMIPTKLYQQRLAKEERNVSNAQETFTQTSQDALSGFHIFYHLRNLVAFKQRMVESSETLEQTKLKAQYVTLKFNFVLSLVNISSQVVLMYVAAVLYQLDIVNIGIILSIGSLSGSFFNAVNNTLTYYTTFVSTKAFLQKFDFKYEEKNIENCPMIEEIELKSVSFNYLDKTVLSDFSYCFKKNHKYLISGESGSGKSTLLKLLVGDIEGTKGEILVNGNKVNASSLSQHIGFIEQEPYLFNLSIYDNLCLGEKFSDRQIQEVLHQVGLEEWVSSYKEGTNHMISDHGKNLSGGQKQRLAIARCLLRNKKILLVDEATSSLDETNAQKIEDLLLTSPNLTIIMIIHRVSEKTKGYFDEVIKL